SHCDAQGKRIPPAEADPITWHGPTPFDAGKGSIHSVPATPPTYSEVFGQWIIEAAERDRRVVAITPAMREGSGLTGFAKRFPDRYHDVGIAEQHAVTLAAGLAAQGLRPVVAIYSTFLQRALDQLIHDVALQRLPAFLRSTVPVSWVGMVPPTREATTSVSCVVCLTSP
ncbi:1-deoxy-D-xylulose-5-phosphate synthase, partial [mine drainage metagenome]